MDSSLPSPDRLTALQRELLDAFFAREQRLHLTGGAALAGFYFGHRTTEDLDLFAAPGIDLDEAERALAAAAAACGASVRRLQVFPDFRRLIAERGAEQCVVDLVVDRAPALVTEKPKRGLVRLDPLRELAANKACTLLSRAEIKDLVDLRVLLESGLVLADVIADAASKDAGVDPATLAWVLEQVTISPEARLPGDTDPRELDAFRVDLVQKLRVLAFQLTQGVR